MKVSTILLVCVFGASLLASANAQFGFGLGLFGGFGAFPMAPPGLFGRIFPPILPYLRPGLALRNGQALFPFGKRDVESQEPLPTETKDELKALCSVSTLTSSLICNGLEEFMNFECAIEPRGNVTRFKLVLSDLIAERPVTREPVNSLKLFSRKSVGKFTYINPINRTQEFVTVFSNTKSQENGFFVKEVACFKKFVNLVGEIPTQQFRISMFSSP
jgi:hypothetical protein